MGAFVASVAFFTGFGLASDNSHCSFAHDRVKSGTDIFYEVQAGNREFVDTTFTKDSMIRWDAHPSIKDNLSNVQVVFVDSIDIAYPEEDGYSLFGETGIQSVDSLQGELGNCWFMHGASAVAGKPGRLERIFLNDELSNNGIYGLQFFVLGVPTTVTIDDVMPLSPNGNLIFARAGDDGALWGPILEKGFAKLQGNYENIVGGDPITSIEILSGAPATRYHHTGHPDNTEFFQDNPDEI